MISLTRQFWINTILFIIACIILALSIWAFYSPCSNEKLNDPVPPIPPQHKHPRSCSTKYIPPIVPKYPPFLNCGMGKIISSDNPDLKKVTYTLMTENQKIKLGWSHFSINIKFTYDPLLKIINIIEGHINNSYPKGITFFKSEQILYLEPGEKNQYFCDPKNNYYHDIPAIKILNYKDVITTVTAFKIEVDNQQFIKSVNLYIFSKFIKKDFGNSARGWVTFEVDNIKLEEQKLLYKK